MPNVACLHVLCVIETRKEEAPEGLRLGELLHEVCQHLGKGVPGGWQ